MYGMYFSAALICGGALIIGRALLAWSGRESITWLEPAAGLAAMLAVAGLLARVPGESSTAAIGLLVLLAAGLAGLRIPYRLDGAARLAIPVGVVIVAILTLPFLVNGRYGLLGVGFNNDLGLHLAWSEWLRSGLGPEPESGYPLGPHALATTVASFPGIGLDQAFSGLLFAITIVTGLTALAALTELGPGRRLLGSVLVAVPYLAASYFAQAAFKETAEALLVLAFAIALPQSRPLPAAGRERARALAPLFVLCAGIVFSYSFAGLAWPIAIAALWSLTLAPVRSALSPRRLLGVLRRPAVIAALALAGALVVFLGFVGPFGFADTFGEVAGSDTYGPVSPAEALGVWPAANYRLDAAGGAPLAGLAAAIGLLALAAGLAWSLARREPALPLAVGAGILLYLGSLPFTGDYAQGKALMIVAPLVMLLSARALLAGPLPGWRVPPAAWWALTAAFVAGALYSSFLALREAPVAPPGHGSELAAFRHRVEGREVIYAGQDRYAAYWLQGADTVVPIVEFPDDRLRAATTKPWDTGIAYSPIDIDSFHPDPLNAIPWIVTSAAAFNSDLPGVYTEEERSDSYVLWKRSGGPVPRGRRTLLEGVSPVDLVDCREPETRIFADNVGRAKVIAEPVVAAKESWDQGPVLGSGEETSQTLRLEAGDYRLSVQYFSPFELELSGPGASRVLKPALDGQRPASISLENDGQYWPAGEITVPETGDYRFTIAAEEAGTLQSLLGYDGVAYIGDLVASPDEPAQLIPLNASCGRWLDWYSAPDRAIFPPIVAPETPPPPSAELPPVRHPGLER